MHQCIEFDLRCKTQKATPQQRLLKDSLHPNQWGDCKSTIYPKMRSPLVYQHWMMYRIWEVITISNESYDGSHFWGRDSMSAACPNTYQTPFWHLWRGLDNSLSQFHILSLEIRKPNRNWQIQCICLITMRSTLGKIWLTHVIHDDGLCMENPCTHKFRPIYGSYWSNSHLLKLFLNHHLGIWHLASSMNSIHMDVKKHPEQCGC